MVDNLPWTFTESNRIVDAKNCTVADCRYTANQGRNIVDTVNAHAKLESRNAKLVAALKAVAQRKLKDGTFCWCGMGYSVEDTHYPFCKRARAALKELGE